MADRCAQCGLTGVRSLKRCTGCWDVHYCSRECQKSHWSRHKVMCTKRPIRASDKDKPARGNDGGPVPGVRGTTGGQDSLQSVDVTASDRGDPDEAANQDPDLDTCKTCQKKMKKMKKCGRCHDATYCSRDCQKTDWPAHKVMCQAMEVLTTDGYRETLRREAAANPRSGISTMSWHEAKSRARRLFPFHEIVDSIDDLDRDFMTFFNPFMSPHYGEPVVAVLKLTTYYFHPFRVARNVQDIFGKEVHMIIYDQCAMLYGRKLSQLKEGNFICIVDARLHGFLDGTVGFRIDEMLDVQILTPQQ